MNNKKTPLEQFEFWIEQYYRINGTPDLNDIKIQIDFLKDYEREYLNNMSNKKQISLNNKSSVFWTDNKIIDFVNWYIKLHKLDSRYILENKTIIDSFKNGEDASEWYNE